MCSTVLLCVLCSVSPVSAALPPLSAPSADASNDLAALNYALTLTRLNFNFYFAGQAKFTQADFTAAGMRAGAYDQFSRLCMQYGKSSDQLEAFIAARGGVARSTTACTYDFTARQTTAAQYAQSVELLEGVTAEALNFVVTALTEQSLQTNLAGQATVSARHHAYLLGRATSVPDPTVSFPRAVDPAAAPSSVQSQLSSFYSGSCSFPQPVIRPGGVRVTGEYSTAVASSSSPISSAFFSRAQFDNDVEVLRYLLVLETHFVNLLTDAASRFGSIGTYQTNAAAYQTILAHKQSHVTDLQAAIAARGASNSSVCPDSFSNVADVPQFQARLQLLGNIEVSGFVGAIPLLTDTTLQQSVVGMAGSNARHSFFFNRLQGANPSADNADAAVSVADTYTALANTGSFSATGGKCSARIVLPVPSFVAPVTARSNDLTALNYLRDILMLNFRFYFWGVGSPPAFPSSAFAATRYGVSGFNNFSIACAQDGEQVSKLSDAITARGGVLNGDCTYNFSSVTSVAAYVTAMSVMENQVVAAFDAALPFFSEPALQTMVASILSVQGRQAGYMGWLNTNSVSGNYVNGQTGLDSLLQPAEAVSAFSVYVVSCPTKTQSLLIRPGGTSTSGLPKDFTLSSLAPTPGTFYSQEEAANDEKSIQFVLKLLDTQFNIYFLALGKTGTTKGDFTAAGIDSTVYDHFSLQCVQDGNAFGALRAILTSRGVSSGGSPLCAYSVDMIMSLPVEQRALKLVQVVSEVENAGARVLANILPYIADTTLQSTLARVLGIQSRHAGFSLGVLQANQFPDDLEPVLTPPQFNGLISAGGYAPTCTAPVVVPAALIFTDNTANDVQVLNYLLNIVHLEAGFWTYGWANLNLANPVGFGDPVGTPNPTRTASQLEAIWNQKKAHVTRLQKLIGAMGGRPVPPCTYSFNSVTDVTTFFSVARTFENRTVATFNGAINMLALPSNQQLLSQLIGTTARHSSWINRAINNQPNRASPNPLDAIVTGLDGYAAYQSCPYPLVTPPIRASGVKFSTVNNPTSTRPQAVTQYTTAQKAMDANVVRYLLQLERAQFALYADVTSRFLQAQVEQAGYPRLVRDEYTLQCAADGVHKSVLTAELQSRGESVPAECSYDFSSITTVDLMVAAVRAVENLASSAYVGILTSVTDTQLQATLQSIGSVQARHASFADQASTQLDGATLAASAELEASSAPAEVIAGFRANGLGSCPVEIVTPGAAPAGPAPLTPSPFFVSGSASSSTGNTNANNGGGGGVTGSSSSGPSSSSSSSNSSSTGVPSDLFDSSSSSGPGRDDDDKGLDDAAHSAAPTIVLMLMLAALATLRM